MTTLDTTIGPGDSDGDSQAKTRRDFLYIATGAVATVGTGLALWPFIDSFNPSADVLSLATTEVDLSPIEPGQRITVIWRSQPVFIVRRTAEQIALARKDDNSAQLIDPQPDAVRVQNPEWLIVIGICTHLGCVPLGQKENDPQGPWGGWFCPCHGSIYDIAGRVRRGPAPENLWLPPYRFVKKRTVEIGVANEKWVPFKGKRGGIYKA